MADGGCEMRAAAALLEVIALAATRQDDDTLFFHYWLSERIRFLLGPRGFDREKLGAHVLPLRSRIQNMITLGINLRGRPAGEFLAARFAIAEESGNQVSGSGAVLDALVSSASFAGAGLLETIDVLSLVPGCADDACMTFARLAGLFYGEKRLLAIRTFGEPLSAFLAPAAGAGGEEV